MDDDEEYGPASLSNSTAELGYNEQIQFTGDMQLKIAPTADHIRDVSVDYTY